MGSSEDFLIANIVDVSWSSPLHKLAMDVALGMAYLHDHCARDDVSGEKSCLIHNDLKV
jgi:hypothetical protein